MIKTIIIGIVTLAIVGGGAYALFHKSLASKASQTTVTQVKSAKPATTPAASAPATATPSSQPSSSPAPAYNY